MNKETRAYYLQILKQEQFYIDMASTILSFVVILLTALSLVTGNRGLFKGVFVCGLLITAINTHKGFRMNTPTRYIYAVCTAVLVVVCVLSFILIH